MAGDKPTFVVIDDDSVLRSLIRGILTDAGLEFAGSAVNGEEGLKLCQDKLPDLVLLDINLPGSDGINVLASLAKMRRVPRVVMVSGEATLPRVKSSISLGASGFVVKPFTAAKLIGVTEQALGRKLA
ncbi:response regulator [Chitinimonas sp. BJYL2]|uniref:response regulator n=1 Tax=Chitinimonas sp. BJYL2 TaxID=2976696 RepID=UPI0022B4C543|nr:response regulator [Chitinimonas sp. BJYL2]